MFGFLRKKAGNSIKGKETPVVSTDISPEVLEGQEPVLPEEKAQTKDEAMPYQHSDTVKEAYAAAFADKQYQWIRDAEIPGLYKDPVFGGYWDSSADICRSYTYEYWFLLKEDARLQDAVKALAGWLGDKKGSACIRILSEEQLPDAEEFNILLRDSAKARIHIIRSISDASEIFLDYKDGYHYTVREEHGWGQADDAADVTEYSLTRIPTELEEAAEKKKRAAFDRASMTKNFAQIIERCSYTDVSMIDDRLAELRKELAELEKIPPEKEPTYNLQCLRRNRIRDKRGSIVYTEKLREYFMKLQSLPCELKVNKNKYLWLPDEPVLTAAYRCGELPSLKEYTMVYRRNAESGRKNSVIFFPDKYFRDLAIKTEGKTVMHVLYSSKEGNSHDEDWEHRYYRIGGSRLFDEFLKTIPEEEPYISNYVRDISSLSSWPGSVNGIYGTLGNIRFIMRATYDALYLTVIGADPDAFTAVSEFLELAQPTRLGPAAL